MQRDPAAAWSPWFPSDSEPWNYDRAGHLMRRAGFGASPAQLEAAVDAGYEATIEKLFAGEGAGDFDKSMEPMERVLASSQDPEALASWWLLRMARTPCPFLEKMTLFWHGHFATSAAKVADSRAMLRQNRLLREHALGKFEPLLQGISRDVAMLVYLDSTDNRKTRPNENYARELMELFCLGPGNYSEQDIKQLARCFTGWEVRRNEFRFNPHQHDGGKKSFLGQSGNFDGLDAVRVVLDQPASVNFIARKLVNFLAVDEVPQDSFCQPVANTLRDSDFEIKLAVRQILCSKFFWSSDCIGRKVRSPVDLAIGLVRALHINTNMNELRGQLAALGHLPMFPPNVKGWEGGRRWINASTFIGRVNLVRQLVAGSPATFEAGSLTGAIGALPGSHQEQALTRFIEGQLPVSLPKQSQAKLLEIAGNREGTADQRLADAITTLAGMPEFHLS